MPSVGVPKAIEDPMRAAWYERNGPAGEVLVVGEMATPQPQAGEVRVRLSTSGVNPSDVKSRRGRPLPFPRIVPHSDGAGIIDAVGPGVPSSRIGERVWIWNGQWQRPFGTAAEFIALPSAQTVRLPDQVDFAAGACMGIPGLTALQAVRLLGPVEERTVLVIGASSAVGHYVTQMAVQAGARVIATVGSEEKARHARRAGAAETILYKAEDVLARLKALTDGRGADAVVDMDFSTTAPMLADGLLRPHGTMAIYGSNDMGDVPVPFMALLRQSLSLKFFLVYDLAPPDRRLALEGITALLSAGALEHTIGARFPLEGIAEAHEAVEGGILGNVVLDLA
jgi:NADPH2:quinone reductase